MPAVFDITVTGDFCAAHRLPDHAGACARTHGHNFGVTAVISAPETDSGGMVMDFLDVKAALDRVLDELDHKDLNALPEFALAPPTAELLAKHIYGRLKTALAAGPARPERVEVRETKDFAAGYREE
jgi:6-pyruvoyltetrahydropterin/6-carboxytetrahydropterin synthase